MREDLFLVLIALHMLAAAAWVGGVLFFLFAVVPAARAAPAAGIATALGRAFRPLAYTALVTLVATGPLLLWVQGVHFETFGHARFWVSAFGTTLGVKAVMIVAVLILTVWHDWVLGPRAERTGAKGAARAIGAVIGLLSVAIFLAGLLMAQGL